jgi:SAM-dependent methyltransferase
MLKISGDPGVMKRLLIRTYRLVPLPLRRRVSRIGPVAWLRRRYFERDTALHDEYYNEAYYEEDFGPTRQSAPAMCRAMLRHLGPADVLDVGCGTGEYLEAFRNAGVPGRGVELATAALEQCRAKGLEVARIDLSKGQELPWTADLVFSFEVAEHIPEEAATGFVETLTAAARKHICLTAAAPGQAGLCHVNCKPKSFWIRLFADRGFAFDEALTGRWERENAEAGLAHWLCYNLMVFHAPAERRD